MGGVVRLHPMWFLSEKARQRALLLRKGQDLPAGTDRAWVLKIVTLVQSAPEDRAHNVRFYLPIPRHRLADLWGGPLSAREAAIRAEGVWSMTDTRNRDPVRSLDRLLCSSAPASWDWGYKSERRKYCVAHCSKCGLHFSSDKAFDQHCRDRHRHPSKSEKLVAIRGVDTVCSLMCTHHNVPINKYLPSLTATAHFVPGVRVWEHSDAEKLREFYAK